jgi:hypothetical protein
MRKPGFEPGTKYYQAEAISITPQSSIDYSFADVMKENKLRQTEKTMFIMEFDPR